MRSTGDWDESNEGTRLGALFHACMTGASVLPLQLLLFESGALPDEFKQNLDGGPVLHVIDVQGQNPSLTWQLHVVKRSTKKPSAWARSD